MGRIMGYVGGGLVFWTFNKYLGLTFQSLLLRALPASLAGGMILEILTTVLLFSVSLLVAELLGNRMGGKN